MSNNYNYRGYTRDLFCEIKVRAAEARKRRIESNNADVDIAYEVALMDVLKAMKAIAVSFGIDPADAKMDTFDPDAFDPLALVDPVPSKT